MIKAYSLAHLILAAAGGLHTSMSVAAGRHPVQTLTYHNMMRSELVLHYKRAYVAAGLTLDSETLDGSGYYKYLKFTFSIPEFPRKSPAQVEIAIGADRLTGPDGHCPCEVGYVVAGVGEDYDATQAVLARARLAVVTGQASVKIRQQLGVSLLDLSK